MTTTVNPVVAGYVTEREDLVRKIEIVSMTAKERGKDPTDDDLEIISNAQARVRKLDGFIEVLGQDTSMSEDVQSMLRKVGSDLVPQVPKYRTAGEAMYDFVHATFGSANDRDDRDAKARWDLVMKRAAQHMGTEASLTTPVAGGFGGLNVSPVVGPIVSVLPQGQPFLTGIGKAQAPSSLSFLRPRISDPNFDTGASAQGLQKAELVSQKFDVVTDTLTMNTVGGYLNASVQLLSLHASAWDIIVNQLRARVARAGELMALANLAQSTGAVTLATGADSATTWLALVQAARMVAVSTQMPATWIAYGPLGWERLAKVVDTTGRPLFPFLGPVNAFGQADLGDQELNVSGLRPLYSPGLAGTSLWIGNSLTFEAYSYPFPVLESVEPSVFGRQIAVAEALAFYRPIANGAVKVG